MGVHRAEMKYNIYDCLVVVVVCLHVVHTFTVLIVN